jgi:hypothetical protein
MGTEDDFAAEEYRQQRRARGWCPVIALGLLTLAASCFVVAAMAVDRVVSHD